MCPRLPYEVNCESCDHLRYLMNRKGEMCGYACESDMESIELSELYPLDWLTCHSLYELYEMEQERLMDMRREEC